MSTELNKMPDSPAAGYNWTTPASSRLLWTNAPRYTTAERVEQAENMTVLAKHTQAIYIRNDRFTARE